MTLVSSFPSALIASVPVLFYLFIRNINHQYHQCQKNEYHQASSKIITLNVRPHIEHSLSPFSRVTDYRATGHHGTVRICSAPGPKKYARFE